MHVSPTPPFHLVRRRAAIFVPTPIIPDDVTVTAREPTKSWQVFREARELVVEVCWLRFSEDGRHFDRGPPVVLRVVQKLYRFISQYYFLTNYRTLHGVRTPAAGTDPPQTRLGTHCRPSQKMTVAVMAMAEKKVWAQRSWWVFDELKNVIVWNKTNGGMGTFYWSKHELIFAVKVGQGEHVNSFGLGDTGR